MTDIEKLAEEFAAQKSEHLTINLERGMVEEIWRLQAVEVLTFAEAKIRAGIVKQLQQNVTDAGDAITSADIELLNTLVYQTILREE